MQAQKLVKSLSRARPGANKGRRGKYVRPSASMKLGGGSGGGGVSGGGRLV